MSFVLQIFQILIQNFVYRGRRGVGRRGGDRGPDTLGHKLHVRQGGRPGKTAGSRGCGQTSVDGVGCLISIIKFALKR
jgi:hypothetical protein